MRRSGEVRRITPGRLARKWLDASVTATKSIDHLHPSFTFLLRWNISP